MMHGQKNIKLAQHVSGNNFAHLQEH